MNKILLWTPVLLIALFWAVNSFAHDVYTEECHQHEASDETKFIGGVAGAAIANHISDGDAIATLFGAIFGSKIVTQEECHQVERPHIHGFKWIKVETIEWL